MSAFTQTSDPEYLQKQLSLARREIHNLRQQLVTLTHTHRKEIESIHNKLEQWRCVECRNDQQPAEARTSTENSPEFKLKYIGTISTHFPEKRGTPRQPGVCSELIAKLMLDNNVFTNPAHALEGLQEFSHMWILFHFHKNDSTHFRAKVAPPRLNGARTGVLATRSPHRPSPIGLSLVKIDRIMDGTIYFSGVDMVDGTPVIDIKPYIPQYDNPGLSSTRFLDESALENLDIQTPSSRHNSLSETFSNVSVGEVSSVQSEDNINGRVMEGAESERSGVVLGASNSDSSNTTNQESFYRRSNSRMGEREAPDGEEEEPPADAAAAAAGSQGVAGVPAVTPEGHIRVPPWIDQAPVPRLTVLFKDRALSQLAQLGSEGEEKKNTIANVLREDPRSVYLRERWGSHCYVFRIADLCVSCKFNDNNHTVTVYQVFQNEGQQPEGEE